LKTETGEAAAQCYLHDTEQALNSQ